jgi:molybdenum transport protein
MVFFSEDDIDRMIKEDVPYFDLTGRVLGIAGGRGEIAYFTRGDIICCGAEEVARIFGRLGISAEYIRPSGEAAASGETLVAGCGAAEALHTAWKVGQNILDHCSGIATETRRVVDAAKSVNPDVTVLTTRKGFPGTKALSVKAILAGGAFPHRLGVSETVLVFGQHMNFIGGIDGFLERLPEIRRSCCEKKIIVETSSPDEAARLCAAGADGIQFDKLAPPELFAICADLKKKFPAVTLLAAGGINGGNIAAYAGTGVDGIVTTSLYGAKPADIGVRIAPLD